jgi:hypothetical protein
MTEAPRKRVAFMARARSIALLAASCGVLVFLYLQNPSETRLVPPCPMRSAAGVVCPGCGSLRAVHHALHGRWREALRFNPVMIAFGLPVLACYLAGLAITACGTAGSRNRCPRWTGWAALAALIAWGIARNLPGLEALTPPESVQARTPPS